jgi:hypothetical protein
MDATYAEDGAKVILCKFQGPEWAEGMEKYVGKTVIINGTGFWHKYVMIEGYCWRIQSMILASDAPLLTPKQRAEMRIQDG